MLKFLQSWVFSCTFLITFLNFLHHTNAELWANPNKTVEACTILTQEGNATGAANVSTRYGADTNDLGIWRVSVESRYRADNIETAENDPNATSPNAVASVWLDPWETIDLNWGGNDFSACAYIFKKVVHNTRLRGQHDDTTCTQMFSKECVKAIETKIAYQAQWQVQSPTLGPYSNLTPPILEPICTTVFGLLGNGFDHSFPEECRPYFDDGSLNWPIADQIVLSGNVSQPTECTNLSESVRFTENGAIGGIVPQNFPPGIKYEYNGTSPANAYDNLTHEVFPILTLIMPAANVSRQGSIGSAYAQMSCIRAKNTTAISRVSPPLPDPTPVHFPSKISKGAIAGIVIGSLLGVALLAGVAWWFVVRRKKRKTGSQVEMVDTSKNNGLDKHFPQIDGSDVYQLPNKEKPAQLHGNHHVEMSADIPPTSELEGSGVEPREMMGSVPAGKKAGKNMHH